jgi:hypothetical protein
VSSRAPSLDKHRASGPDGVAIQTNVRTKPRAPAPRLELVARTPGGTAALGEMERSLTADPDSLAVARIDLARSLRSRKAELQEVIFTHVLNNVPDGCNEHDAQLTVGLSDVITACVDCGLASIEQGARWSAPIPPVVAAQATRDASSGLSLTTALSRCVAGHTLLWSFVLEEVVRHDLPGEQSFALLLQASAAMGATLGSLQAVLAEAHSSEIVRRARSHEQRRAEIVDKLLLPITRWTPASLPSWATSSTAGTSASSRPARR